MGLFGIVLLVLFAIVCTLLIFMVVIQDQEGGGLGGIFSGAGSAAFGSRSSNVIVKFTYILGALFFVIAFGLALINRGDSIGNVEAAARTTEQQAATTEWWNAESQAPAQTLEGIEPTATIPQESPLPAADGQ
ncbi:MAG: preprotein translocase subunit SecG [Spirochaetales bacterium]|nr:MAG: preprotein translocase subunit SecG [Spirochaetales bacterium]